MSDKIKDYFKDYPKKDKCHETADGYIFHEEGDAKEHAKSLKVKQVKTHERPMEKEPAKTTDTASGKGTSKGKANKDAKAVEPGTEDEGSGANE